MSTLNAFCTQLINLMNNLHELYPNDQSISISITSISLLKQTNPRKLTEIFGKFVLPYEDMINEEDEQFFLQTNFVDKFHTISDRKDLFGGSGSYADTIMQNLKKYWGEVDNDSKENIWKYFKVLVILYKKC